MSFMVQTGSHVSDPYQEGRGPFKMFECPGHPVDCKNPACPKSTPVPYLIPKLFLSTRPRRSFVINIVTVRYMKLEEQVVSRGPNYPPPTSRSPLISCNSPYISVFKGAGRGRGGIERVIGEPMIRKGPCYFYCRDIYIYIHIFFHICMYVGR